MIALGIAALLCKGLFAVLKQTASNHIINILKENELTEAAVVQVYLTTAADSKSYNMLF